MPTTRITYTTVKKYVKQINTALFEDSDITEWITKYDLDVLREVPQLSGDLDLLDQIVLDFVVYKGLYLLGKPDASAQLKKAESRLEQARASYLTTTTAPDSGGIRTQGRLPNSFLQDHPGSLRGTRTPVGSDDPYNQNEGNYDY